MNNNIAHTMNPVRLLTIGILTALVGLFGLQAANATGRAMHFEHLTLADGLSQNTVMAILQDSQGYLWFGTENGLNRYDGYSFTRFARDSRDPSALRSDFIWAMAEDAKTNLWLATDGGGVARWDRRSGEFENFVHDATQPESLASNLVRTLIVDRDGAVWVAHREAGLDRLDPATGRVTHFRHDPADPTSLSSDSVFSLLQDRAGRIWVGTSEGLNRLDQGSNRFTRYVNDPNDATSLSHNEVITLYEDRLGTLWVGTFDGGLNRLDRTSNRFTRFMPEEADATSISDPHVRAIFEDDKQRLWVGTADGLNLFDRDAGNFTRYHEQAADTASLSDSYVMSLYQDRGGILWVGTRSGGVSKWNPRSWSLGHIKLEGMPDANVIAIAEEATGNLWVGTLGSGLVHARATGDVIRTYRSNGEAGSISDDRVMSLLLDRSGLLWIGTMAGGLNRIDTATGDITVFRHDPADPTSIGADGIMSLYESRDGNVWIGTYGGGLALWQRETGQFRQYRHDPTDPASLGGSRITAIVEDDFGSLWVASDGAGISILNRELESFSRFEQDFGDPASLSSNTIYALHVDSTGRVWVGTSGEGLDLVMGSSLTPESIRFQSIDSIKHAPGNSIYGIQSDFEGSLWLSTNNGLTRFNPRSRELKTFHSSHGLQGDEFNAGAHHQGANGMLYFGGANGVNAFRPAALEEGSHAPAVLLTGYEILNQPAASDEPYSLMPQVALGYRDQVVTFEFAALDFANPAANRYAYRLSGFDADWVDIGNRRRVTYTNLAAGEYLFEVRAANSDGVWSETPIQLPISVEPAPWRTIWAYLSYALLALFVLAQFWQAQQRKLKQKAEYSRILEQQVRDRTRELQEQNVRLEELSRAKSDFLARMSHEIRTPMNGVLGMTQLMLGTDLTDQQRRFTTTINNSAESLLEIINDILDFSKIEAGKLQLEEVPFDLTVLVEETIGLFAGPAFEKGLDLLCATPPEHDLQVIGDPLRLRQVLVNLIANAVKFTDEGEIVLRCHALDTSADDLLVEFEVTDTGIGINEENRSRIFEVFSQEDGSTTRRFGGSGLGLAISKQLVELMGGEITVTSVAGQGSTFRFTARLGKSTRHEGGAISASLQRQRVLIVSDSATSRKIIEEQLAAWKINTAVAESGEAAREELANATEVTMPFDVAIIDSRLPDMAVQVLFDEIERDLHLRNLKTILLGSLNDCDSSAPLQDPNADAQLTKPVRQSDLYEALITVTGCTDARAILGCAEELQEELPCIPARVLLVEDHPVNQAVASGMLRQLGCDVALAENGKAAVERLAVENFDVVLMDCQMPVMDGFQATKEIRGREGAETRTPIVALTANALQGDREKCLAAGMDDYLSKPFSPQQLGEVIMRWVETECAADDTIPPWAEMSAADGGNAVLDQRALDNIRQIRSVDGRAMLPQVIDYYLDSSTALMDQLEHAVPNEDFESIYQAAHSLKSSSANLGANGFAELCRRLETMARNKEPEQLQTTYEQLRDLYPKVVSALAFTDLRKSA
ncbi:MAG: two-component regulator propeller domain-containing protein [Gammaproteobacteria bacterium]|nr:two-component regulator propeller domain-containing protein [Gammaproteobacteria bacterium]